MPNYTREISRTFDCGTSPRLDFRTVNGSVRVRGEDRGDVHVAANVRYRAYTDDEADDMLRAIQDGIHAEGDHVTVRSPDTETSSFFGAFRSFFGHGRHLEIDLDVRAPKGCFLDLRHVNGAVDTRQVGGDVGVHTVNGRFDGTDIGGDLSVHQVNGRCDIRNVGGNVALHHTNGAVDIERAGGDISLRLVNGRVDIRHPGGAVDVKGVSGAYSVTGAIQGDVSINNSHGKITLNLPRNSRFQLDAQSVMGTVTSELEVRDGNGGGAAGPVPAVHLRSETGRIELLALREAAPAGV